MAGSTFYVCLHRLPPSCCFMVEIFSLIARLAAVHLLRIKLSAFSSFCSKANLAASSKLPSFTKYLTLFSSFALARYFIASYLLSYFRQMSIKGSYPMGDFFDFENFSNSIHWFPSASTDNLSHQNRFSGTLNSLQRSSASFISLISIRRRIVCWTDRPSNLSLNLPSYFSWCFIRRSWSSVCVAQKSFFACLYFVAAACNKARRCSTRGVL
uniref:Uncharacterized protein n=1 Tax=Ixodes ricinus TaxID=34613 RepID=A0A147BFQ5_IXORI